MSTSGELPGGGVTTTGTASPAGDDLTRQIALLANQVFGAAPAAAPNASHLVTPTTGAPPAVSPVREPPLGPAPALPSPVPTVASPPFRGPSALQPGLSGVSTGANGPPLPGFLHTPPLAAAPPPREGDLRGGITQVAEQAGISPIQLFEPTAVDAPPYFLGLAGLPGGVAPGAFDLANVPTAPSAPTPVLGAIALPSDVPLAGADQPSNVRPEVQSHSLREGITITEFRPEVVPNLPSATRGAFDPNAIKRDFPILQERVHGKQLVWLDNAATTQKPRAVIDRLSYFYSHENSNIHRAAHTLAARATDAYESAREKVRRFLNAPSAQEIVFTRGATEAINLVAKAWGSRFVEKNDEIVVTWLEHHANIVPWQQLAAEKGAVLRVAPVDDRGQVILEEFEKLLTPRTRLVSITQVSNALGTITPTREMVAIAHRYGAKVLVDGAQAVSHMSVDVQALDADFYVFSGHKVFAPTGIGALFGKAAVLETMPPWQGGGNMIADVRFERTQYQPPPFRFEAGTGNIADAAGLGAAIDYVTAIGLDNIGRYEHELVEYGTECLNRLPGLHIIGTAPDKAGVLSFVIDGVRTEDLGAALDKEGIAVRAGHHCAQPILRRFGLEATVRASLAPYNTREDLEALTSALSRITGRPLKA